MSAFDPLFSQAEQQYGLPPGILAATAKVESRLNPQAVSPKGAVGLMQIMPATAASLGVNPHDPAQAVDAAGRLWAQNLKATGGDIDKAAMMYNAGPDPRHWNNSETRAYPGKLAAALGPSQAPQQGGGDPIEAALSGHPVSASSAPVQADPNDPIEAALSGAKSTGDVRGSDSAAAGNTGSQSGVPGNSGSGDAAGRNILSVGQGAQSGGNGAQAPGLQQHPLDAAANWISGTSDAAVNGMSAGLLKPFNAVLDTVIPNRVNGQKTATIWDGSAFGNAFHHDLALERGQADQFHADHPVASTAADLFGAMASPANKLFVPAEGAGFLRSIPNFMAQGAAYGGVRGAADEGTVKGALTDAGIGAAVAPVGAAVAGGAGKLLGAALKARSTLANAIPQSVKQQVAAMIDHGASVDDIVSAVPEAKNLEYVSDWVGYRARGGKAPVSFREPPTPVDDNAPIVITATRNKALAAALGTQESRRGVEAISDLPAPVTQDVQRLTQGGVSPAEAQAEADIRYVGGKPTVANVTRSPAEQRAMFEGAKQSTPEGAQLADTVATNNQALHDTVTRTVDNYGGVPAQGEAAETAAQALAKASDAARANVTAKYTAARAQDGDVKINTDALRELLQSPEMATPTNPEVKQLSTGLLAHLQAVDQRVGTTLRTPEEVEQIRQLANSAYNPMGGTVNGAVGKIGGALNDGLDQLDTASAAWKAARAAHRDWASQYSDPAGVAKLISRDAKGNFLNADQWRQSESGLIDRLNDKPFAQVVGQLKKIGANDALGRLKAGIIQRAYERSTNTARDQLGNPVLNGKLFQNELNKIGLPKLQALFSKDELAHLATVGRAARALNEAVPGTVNTSGTSSSLINALGVKPGSHPYMKGVKYVAALTGHIPAAVAAHGVEHLSTGAAQKAIGQGVKEQLNPALARAVAGRSTARIQNAQFRAAVGRALRNRGAVPAADNDRQRSLGRSLRNAL